MNSRTIGEKFEHLVAVMARLRSPEGCIWDREQTHESLRQYLLEETYEVLETIDHKNHDELGKELGDLLLQVIFHAQIAAEAGRFDIGEVIDNISDKMIRRHPHVFGDERVSSVAEQKLRWEEIKKKEGKKSATDGVPAALPALQRAARLRQKANKPAPDWQDIDAVYHRFKSLVKANERESAAGGDQLYEVAGELLFMLVGISTASAVNPEDALREACERFLREFSSHTLERS
jgi:tetrapyrrole methylase family protein/MazG family protein